MARDVCVTIGERWPRRDPRRIVESNRIAIQTGLLKSPPDARKPRIHYLRKSEKEKFGLAFVGGGCA